MAETLSLPRRDLRADHRAPLADQDLDPSIPASATLVVGNMHCGGCMRGVENALLAVPGVVAARANLTNRRVTVSYLGARTGVVDFTDALRDAGFEASELVETSAQADDAARHTDELRRLGVAGFAAANVMLLSVAVWSGIASDMDASLQTALHWLSALIALPAIAYSGKPFFASARQALSAWRLNMDVPISLGVLLATGMSLVQTIRGSELVYFDAAITLLFFLLIGRFLDTRMRTRAASAAENLLGLQAVWANVLDDRGHLVRMPARDVAAGMRLAIAAGDRIPVDARIIRGAGDVDESLITGESLPRTIGPGDDVYAGTVNLNGVLEAEASTAHDGTLLARIAQLMETAEQARGRYVRLADRAVRFYAPAVHLLALVTLVGWIAAGQSWVPALNAAIAVLIITCPCALALAVPAVQVVATSRLLRSGTIIKASDALERLSEVDTVVFDKTGTLTLGEPRLAASTVVSDQALGVAAGLALVSRHPYAKAVVKAAAERGLTVSATPDVTEVAGAGLRAETEGDRARLGSAAFCGIGPVLADTSQLWLLVDGQRPVGFSFEDALRSDASVVVRQLKDAGFRVVLLSGDRSGPVADIAGRVGITDSHAVVTPDGKLRHLNALRDSGHKVLMVGDGLNDAPALAAGHASLSPSSAAEISQTTADAVFQGEALAPVVDTLVLARAAQNRAVQNFGIALGYNALFVPLAMAGHVTPLIAAIAMSASSIAVTANALRLSVQRLGRLRTRRPA